MTVLDIFDKRGEACALKAKDGHETVKALEKLLVKLEYPRTLLTDNGREFVNAKLISFCKKHTIRLIHGSPYCPTTTRAVERFNQTLMRKQKKITEFGKYDWEEMLPRAVRAYNISWSRSTGVAPFECRTGRIWFNNDKSYFPLKKRIKKVVSRSQIRRNLKKYKNPENHIE